VRPRRDFAALEQRRMRAADLFEQGVIPAEIARQVGVSHQIVSDWRTVWRRYGRDGLHGAGRAGRRPKLGAEQLDQVEAAPFGSEEFNFIYYGIENDMFNWVNGAPVGWPAWWARRTSARPLCNLAVARTTSA
jgi:Homeodomain-like domain